MAFPHLKGKLTLLERKNQNEIRSSWRLFSAQIFFFIHAACTAMLSLNGKNNNTIFTVSKNQAMRKLNNQTTTSFVGLFLTIGRFNWFEWLHSHKNKETFYLFFYLRNLYFCDYDDSIQTWQIKLQYTLYLKSFVQLLICNVFLTVM